MDEDVEAVGLRLEGFGGFGDGGKGGQVEREKGDFGRGDFFENVGDGGFGFGLGARGEEDVGWIVFCELENGLLA